MIIRVMACETLFQLFYPTRYGTEDARTAQTPPFMIHQIMLSCHAHIHPKTGLTPTPRRKHNLDQTFTCLPESCLLASYHPRRGSSPPPVRAHLRTPLPIQRLLGGRGRVQVDVKGKDVGREDEGDDPLQHGALVVVLGGGAGRKGDGQRDLDDDECELDVEGYEEDAVFAVVCCIRVGKGRQGVTCERGVVWERGETYTSPTAGIPSR